MISLHEEEISVSPFVGVFFKARQELGIVDRGLLLIPAGWR